MLLCSTDWCCSKSDETVPIQNMGNVGRDEVNPIIPGIPVVNDNPFKYVNVLFNNADNFINRIPPKDICRLIHEDSVTWISNNNIFQQINNPNLIIGAGASCNILKYTYGGRANAYNGRDFIFAKGNNGDYPLYTPARIAASLVYCLFTPGVVYISDSICQNMARKGYNSISNKDTNFGDAGSKCLYQMTLQEMTNIFDDNTKAEIIAEMLVFSKYDDSVKNSLFKMNGNNNYAKIIERCVIDFGTTMNDSEELDENAKGIILGLYYDNVYKGGLSILSQCEDNLKQSVCNKLEILLNISPELMSHIVKEGLARAYMSPIFYHTFGCEEVLKFIFPKHLEQLKKVKTDVISRVNGFDRLSNVIDAQIKNFEKAVQQ